MRLVDLLDEAVERAAVVVREKAEQRPVRARRSTSARPQVGIGAVKYADLSNSMTRDYVFDLDRMVSLNGDTSVYLQYAYARIRSIFRKAGGQQAGGAPGAGAGPRRAGARAAPGRVRRRAGRRSPRSTSRTSWPPTSTSWPRSSRPSTSTARCWRPTRRTDGKPPLPVRPHRPHPQPGPVPAGHPDTRAPLKPLGARLTGRPPKGRGEPHARPRATRGPRRATPGRVRATGRGGADSVGPAPSACGPSRQALSGAAVPRPPPAQ